MDHATAIDALFEYQQRVCYHDGDYARALQDLKAADLQMLKRIADDIKSYEDPRGKRGE